jgi:4-carboxymuconolactone decarboxylase
MRLEQLNEATLTAEQHELYEAIAGRRPGNSVRAANLSGPDGSVLGPFNHMLLAPDLGAPLQELGGVLRFGGALPDRARELVILTVARAWRSEFEWFAHVAVARSAGVSDDEIAAVRNGEVLALEDPIADAAVVTACALLERDDLTDDEFAYAHTNLGTAMLVELTTLVGYYALLAMQLRAFRVGLPASAEPVFTTNEHTRGQNE